MARKKKTFSSQDEMYDYYFQELAANRREDLIRAAKALEKENYKENKCDAILKYYMKETGGGDPLTEEETDAMQNAWGSLWDAGVVRPEWAALYKKKTGHFSPYYIGHDIQYYYTEWNKIDYDYVPAFCDKNYIDIVLPYIRHPKTLVRKIRWTYLNEQFEPLGLAGALDLIEAHKDEGLVLKISRSSYGGKGVSFIDGETTRDQIKSMLVNERDVTVQALIHQHPKMAALNESSVNSIRVMTMIVDGKAVVLSSVTRIGSEGSRVDNFSSGGIAVGITPEGKLNDVGYIKNGEQTTVHPNGFVFGGYEIPGFEKTLETVKRLQYCVPVFGIVSWDIAIDEDEEPVLIEYNVGHGGILTHQYCNGPLYGEYHEKIISTVFKNYPPAQKHATLDFNYTLDDKGAAITKGSHAIEDLVIPAAIGESPVTSVAKSAFSGCDALKTLTIEGEMHNLKYLSFYSCTALKSVVVKGSLREIHRSAFNKCTALEEVHLSEGTRFIGMRSFANCPNLKLVVLPASVTEIAGDAFEQSPEVTIRAPYDTYAERYAENHGIRFEPVEED